MHTRTHPTGRRSARRALTIAAAAVVGAGLMSVSQPALAAHGSHATHATAATAKAHQHRVYAHHSGLGKATNGRIAYVRAGRIYTANASGDDVATLTALKGNQRPHYSPDGTRIAYLHHTRHVGWNVWVMNADGSDKQQVTHLHFVTEAQWSPDGQWLVFGPQLMKVHSTAPFGDPVPILGGADGELDPINIDTTVDWSPDGTTLAFYSHEFPDSPDDYLLTLDLSSHVISEWNAVGGSCCGEGFFGDPAYSRDGKYLAYTHLVYIPEIGEHATRPDIEMDNVNGPGFGPFPMVKGDKDPEFSPDGSGLLVSHVKAGKLMVLEANLNGSGRHVVLKGTQPDWQPIPSGT